MVAMPRVHLQGKKAVCSIDGTPMAVEDGSYTTTTGVDEVTNLLSEGYYEDLDTIKRATCSLRCVYDGNSPPDFDEGDIVALSITVPGATGPPAVPGGPALGGNFRITSMTYPIVNPKGSVRYSFEASSNGVYTKGVSSAAP
jgi:hypothetical protein